MEKSVHREEKKREERGESQEEGKGRCEEERSPHFLGGLLRVAQGTHHLYIYCSFQPMGHQAFIS